MIHALFVYLVERNRFNDAVIADEDVNATECSSIAPNIASTSFGFVRSASRMRPPPGLF
jgi:hypothetical protein